MPKKNQNPSAVELSSSLRAQIAAEVKTFGITHSQVFERLAEEVEASVCIARQEGDKIVAAAREKAAQIEAEAREAALKRALKPAHACSLLARILTSKDTFKAEGKRQTNPAGTSAGSPAAGTGAEATVPSAVITPEASPAPANPPGTAVPAAEKTSTATTVERTLL